MHQALGSIPPLLKKEKKFLEKILWFSGLTSPRPWDQSPTLKNKIKIAGGLNQVVRPLPCIHQALSLIPTTAKSLQGAGDVAQ
jgi:hypothetical protein